MTDERYPEHERMAEVQRDSQTIGEFLDTCGYQLAVYDEDYYGGQFLRPLHKSITQVLADYFDINLDTIEDEKRQMLARIRSAHEATAALEDKP